MGTPLLILGTGHSGSRPAPGWIRTKHLFVLLIGVAIWLLARFLDGRVVLAMIAVLSHALALAWGRFSQKIRRIPAARPWLSILVLTAVLPLSALCRAGPFTTGQYQSDGQLSVATLVALPTTRVWR